MPGRVWTLIVETRNILFGPYFLPRGIFKRSEKLNYPSTQARLAAQYALEGTRDTAAVEIHLDMEHQPLAVEIHLAAVERHCSRRVMYR